MAVIADTETRAEIAEALGHMNHQAKRLPHIYGGTCPSRWDRLHEAMNVLLSKWEAAE